MLAQILALHSKPTAEMREATDNIPVQEREETGLTEWDRFAKTEYMRLAMEEEGEGDEMSMEAAGGTSVWDEDSKLRF